MYAGRSVIGIRGRAAAFVAAGLLFAFAPSAAQAAFPGDNGQIAFDSFRPNTSSPQLRTINSDGTGEGSVIEEGADQDSEAAWSPDGTKIVFSRLNVNQVSEIWVVNADGSGETKLTDGHDVRPAFSGDGTKIVFVRDEQVWVMNANGSNETQITTLSDSSRARDAVFSPDSSKIAVTIDDDTLGLAVWLMNANGSGLQPLTPTGFDEFGVDPDFSPDGQTIVFSRCPDVIEGCNTEWRIAVISVTGGAITDITSPPDFNDDFGPVFSPDGTQVAFYRQAFEPPSRVAGEAATGADATAAAVDPGGFQIQVVSAGGGTVTGISSRQTDRLPDWQPLSPSSSGGGGGSTADSPGGAALGSSSKSGKRCRGVPVTIRTTNGKDVVIGTPDRDVVHGQRGNDVIKGLNGDDRLCGGRDNDKIRGGKGRDVIYGGDHSDLLLGGPNLDRIFGGTPDAPDRKHIDRCRGGNDFMRNCQRRG